MYSKQAVEALKAKLTQKKELKELQDEFWMLKVHPPLLLKVYPCCNGFSGLHRVYP